MSEIDKIVAACGRLAKPEMSDEGLGGYVKLELDVSDFVIVRYEQGELVVYSCNTPEDDS